MDSFEGMTKAEVQQVLGVSAKTVQRRIAQLERVRPEMIRRDATSRGSPNQSRVRVLVSRRALEDGLLGQVKKSISLSSGSGQSLSADPDQVVDRVDQASLRADAFEADNERLRAQLRVQDAETAALLLKQENDQLRGEVEKLQAHVRQLGAAVTALTNPTGT